MTISSFDPKTQIVSVTNDAGIFLKEMQQRHPNEIIRFSTKKAGCSGFAYTLDFVAAAESNDIQVEPVVGLSIFVDNASLPMIKGTEIDLEILGLNRQIKYNNPNVTGECGCGESFSVS